MRVLLSTYGSRGDVEPMVGLAAQFGTVAAAAEGCDALAATGLFPAAADAVSREKAASARVNHAGSSSQDPEHDNLQTLMT